MSYQQERDQFIAQMTREGLPIWATQALLRAATGFNRRAELACSSEAADRDRVKCPASRAYDGLDPTARDRVIYARRLQSGKYPCLCDAPNDGHSTIPRITLQDWHAETRLEKLLAEVNKDLARLPAGLVAEGVSTWRLLTAGDPRGYTLRVIPPSYHERNQGKDRHNQDSIGVPARESRIRW